MQITTNKEGNAPTTPQDSGNIVRGVGSGQPSGLGNNMSPEEAGVRPEDSEVKPKSAPQPYVSAADAGVDPRDSGVITNGVRPSLQLETPTPLPQSLPDVNLSGIDGAARGGTPSTNLQE